MFSLSLTDDLKLFCVLTQIFWRLKERKLKRRKVRRFIQQSGKYLWKFYCDRLWACWSSGIILFEGNRCWACGYSELGTGSSKKIKLNPLKISQNEFTRKEKLMRSKTVFFPVFLVFFLFETSLLQRWCHNKKEN